MSNLLIFFSNILNVELFSRNNPRNNISLFNPKIETKNFSIILKSNR